MPSKRERIANLRQRLPLYTEEHAEKKYKVIKKKRDDVAGDMLSEQDSWMPGTYTALKILLSARLCSAVWGLINDCDETFNYWEPMHYLLYGRGFQTWEYSPTFAIRSYAYILLYLLPAWVCANIFMQNRIMVFFFVKCMLALFASSAELYYYKGIAKIYGGNIASMMLAISVFSSGMFISSTAFLPSSFAMCVLMIAMGAWFHQSIQLFIFAVAVSVILGWPFVFLIGIPFALNIIIKKHLLKLFIKWSVISSVTLIVPILLIDSQFYGRIVFAPLNIVLYNIFTPHGPDIYGAEPWHFYIINSILNFNVVFLLSISAFPLCMLLKIFKIRTARKSCIWLNLSPLYIWFLVFILQSHKEERFLFPVYPFICFAAAYSIDALQKLWCFVFKSRKNSAYLISLVLISVSSIFSISRSVGQYRAYHAPFDVYMELHRLNAEGYFSSKNSKNICVGREWYRFPSSFFLPDLNWNLKFLESEFQGQLPKLYFEASNGTLIIPSNMNDKNLEERTRYVDLSICDFLIDIDHTEETRREPRYLLQNDKWKVLYSVPFLNSKRSNKFLRAFYIPFLTERYSSYLEYNVLVSKKLIKN